MGKAFSRGDSAALQQYDSFLQGRICTMCGGCLGECPHGVNHTDLLRVVMYRDGYRNDQLVREAVLTEDLQENSRRCFDCPACSITCRRGLDIRAQMELVKRAWA